MPIAGSYISLTFDANAASRYVQKRLKDILTQGMVAWVEEAKSIIPVWSGASRAALTQIAGFVGVPVFGPGKGTGSAHSNEIVTTKAKTSPTDGQASETFTPPTVDGGRVFTRWSTNLFHLNVNERVNVNTLDLEHPFHLTQPGPYYLRKRCNDAAKQVIVSELNRFQYRIRSFISFRRIKIGG